MSMQTTQLLAYGRGEFDPEPMLATVRMTVNRLVRTTVTLCQQLEEAERSLVLHMLCRDPGAFASSTHQEHYWLIQQHLISINNT